MDYTFFGDSPFLLKMGIVAVAVVILGVMIRKKKTDS